MPATSTANVRFDHSNCKHARTGAEGKKARAACRKAHAAEAAKVDAKGTKATTPRKRATRKVAPKATAAAVKETVPVDELDDSDI